MNRMGIGKRLATEKALILSSMLIILRKNRGGMYVFLLDLGLDSFFLYFEDGTMGKLY